MYRLQGPWKESAVGRGTLKCYKVFMYTKMQILYVFVFKSYIESGWIQEEKKEEHVLGDIGNYRLSFTVCNHRASNIYFSISFHAYPDRRLWI